MMGKQLRPVTIESLALFAEKAGQLAAIVIRERPEEARALSFALFETVMLSFSHAVDGGAVQLRESAAYEEFGAAWCPALRNAMDDLVPDSSVL